MNNTGLGLVCHINQMHIFLNCLKSWSYIRLAPVKIHSCFRFEIDPLIRCQLKSVTKSKTRLFQLSCTISSLCLFKVYAKIAKFFMVPELNSVKPLSGFFLFMRNFFVENLDRIRNFTRKCDLYLFEFDVFQWLW